MTKEEEKRLLRARFKTQRDAIAPQRRALIARRISERIRENTLYQTHRVLLSYAGIGSELDLTQLHECALADGKVLAFPRLVGKEMHFHSVQSLSQLEVGRFGIRTPAEHAPEILDFSDALCIVPALICDLHGHRLGWGGGYYDRFLSKVGKLDTLCAVYDDLIQEVITAEEHDERVGLILSEEREVFVHEA